MMQECPRCGFLQPQDRYCAYCGLDIESFLTKPQPWYRRLLLNTAIQVGALGVTICITFGYIYWQQKGLPSFSEVLLRAQQQHFLPEPATTATTEGTNTDDPAFDQDFDEDRNGLERVPSSQREGVGHQDSSSPLNSQEKGNPDLPNQKAVRGEIEKPKTSPPAKLFLRFAEIPREFLAQIFSESQIIQESQQVQAVRYSTNQSIEEILKKNPRSVLLPGKKDTAFLEGRLQMILGQIPPPGSNELLNFNFGIQVSSLSPLEMVLETEGILFIKGASPEQTVQLNLAGSYPISVGSVLILTGFIPHRPFNEKDLGGFRETPLVILISPEFQANESEFAILLQAK